MSPRKPSASRSAAACWRPRASRPAKPPARIRSSLRNSGEGGRPASVPSESPSRCRASGSVRAMPVTACPAARGSCAEQRRRGVEAERFRERVPGDVDRDAGERERGREADPERDHAHVLEARVGEQPLPGERAPEERHRDRERGEPEPDQHRLRRCRAPTTGASACSERQAISSTVGSSAAESSARDRRRGFGVRVGEPVVDRRPADLGREARRAAARRRRAPARVAGVRSVESVCQESAPSAAGGRRRARMTIPSSATPSPSEVRIRYFQPASSARAFAAEADEQRRGGRGRLDQQPGDAEVAGERDREQERPERVEQHEVDARGERRGDDRARSVPR